MGPEKNQSSGGVHLCSKCGWPYSNSHPSAKQRRAHKNICGTVEGFKLVTNGFDDAPNSDEDRKNPSAKVPKVMENTSLDGGVGAVSNRSEGKVFSDAAIELQDSEIGVERQDGSDNVGKPDEIADKDLTATLSSKHSEDSDIVQPQHNSADRSLKPIVSIGPLEHQGSEDRNGSDSDVVLVETETLKGVPEQSTNVVAGASAAECSVEQLTDTNGNEEGKLNKNSGEISETVSVLDKRLDVPSDVSATFGKMKDITSVAELADKIVESYVIDRDCISQDKCDTALTNQLDKEIEIDALYMHVAEDGYELGGNNEAIVKEVLFEGKAGVLQGHKWSDALSTIDADTTENEKDKKVCSLQEQRPVYVADGLDFTGFSVSMINGLPDVQPMVTDADIEAGKLNNVSNLHEVTNFDDVGKMETEKHNISVVESGDGLDDSIKANSTSESIITDDQSQDVIKEVNETEGTHLDRVSNGEYGLMEPELRDNKVQVEGAGEDSTVDNTGGGNDSHTGGCGPAASKTSTLQGESDNGSVKPQLDTTVGNVSIGSSSHTDSLEALWGSISVLSTQVEKAKKSKVASEQHFDELNEFEPPSFMTLPGGGDEKAIVRAIPVQAGWFPSLTHVENESPGRKRNEEVGTPLKNLLFEDETKPKSVRLTQSVPPVVIRTYEKVAEDNEDMGHKVSLIPGSKTPVVEPTIKEPGNEWDSPARFPDEIKQQKGKVKGRPIWFQFMCCSSSSIN